MIFYPGFWLCLPLVLKEKLGSIYACPIVCFVALEFYFLLQVKNGVLDRNFSYFPNLNISCIILLSRKFSCLPLVLKKQNPIVMTLIQKNCPITFFGSGHLCCLPLMNHENLVRTSVCFPHFSVLEV